MVCITRWMHRISFLLHAPVLFTTGNHMGITSLRHLFLAFICASFLCLPAQAASIRGGSSGKALEQELQRRKKQAPVTSNETLKKVDDEAIRKAAIKAGPLKPSSDQSHRTNFPDPKQVPTPKRVGAYPWHFDITATYF